MASLAQPLLSAPKDKYSGPVHFEDKITDHSGTQMVIEEKHGKAESLQKDMVFFPSLSCIFLYILALTVTANLSRLLSLPVGLRLEHITLSLSLGSIFSFGKKHTSVKVLSLT